MDGTDFKVARQTPHKRDKQFYSHKFRHAALRYEVAVCIQTGDIVWINGPFRAGKWPDINIFRCDLIHKLLPNELVEADRGYRDAAVRHCDVVVSRSDARAKSRAMRRHETVNSDLKTFACLGNQWRHKLLKHSLAFESCALLTQMKYKLEGGPKFHCKYWLFQLLLVCLCDNNRSSIECQKSSSSFCLIRHPLTSTTEAH